MLYSVHNVKSHLSQFCKFPKFNIYQCCSTMTDLISNTHTETRDIDNKLKDRCAKIMCHIHFVYTCFCHENL